MSRPRFFAPSARADSRRVALPPEEAHHLRHVLRLGAGADVAVFDGLGREWAGRVVALGRKDESTVELLGEIAPAVEPPARVTLGIGVLKGDQMDAVVRDATMLGVSAIVPIVSAHVSVPPRAWRSSGALERWQRIAVASAKQCGRAVVPAIGQVAEVHTLIEDAKTDLGLICVEPAHEGRPPASLGAMSVPSTVLALVGPEGGWSAEELDLARRREMTLLHLGPRTLRAETAPTVLLSALWTVWGW